MKHILILGGVISVCLNASALAEDISSQVEEKCMPAKAMVKFYEKMTTLKPARLDTLEAVMEAKLTREDETVPFNRLWTRTGGKDIAFSVDADGKVTDFHSKVSTLPREAELCGEIITPEGEKPKVGLSMSSDVLFKNRTGPYSLAELQDGVGDGKSFYKKMFGGPMALLVPKMTHVSLSDLNKPTPLQINFTQAGQSIASPPVEMFGDTFVIALEDIEASGADTMTVSGGPFKLMPTPSVKKMKSLGFTADGEDEGDEDSGD